MKNEVLMFTARGQEVIVHKKIEEGWLGHLLYDFQITEDEVESDEDGRYKGPIEFFDHLFEKPQIAHLNDEIASLEGQILDLSSSISELQQKKRNEESVLKKISKIPGLQSIVNYLSGDFNFIIEHDDLKISSRQDVYLEKDLLIEMNKKGEVILLLNDYHKRRISTFNTKSEASAERKKLYLIRISNCSNIYQLEELWKSYSYKDLMDQPDVISLHDSKLSEIRETEKKNQINSTLKEIDEKIQFLKKKDINLRLVEEDVK